MSGDLVQMWHCGPLKGQKIIFKVRKKHPFVQKNVRFFREKDLKKTHSMVDAFLKYPLKNLYIAKNGVGKCPPSRL
jgi:hypothetical protein